MDSVLESSSYKENLGIWEHRIHFSLCDQSFKHKCLFEHFFFCAKCLFCTIWNNIVDILSWGQLFCPQTIVPHYNPIFIFQCIFFSLKNNPQLSVVKKTSLIRVCVSGRGTPRALSCEILICVIRFYLPYTVILADMFEWMSTAPQYGLDFPRLSYLHVSDTCWMQYIDIRCYISRTWRVFHLFWRGTLQYYSLT